MDGCDAPEGARRGPASAAPHYRRILVKLSGEALMGAEPSGIDPAVMGRLAGEIGGLIDLGVQVALVVGGGNLFRGAALHGAGLDRVTGDHMGMLATLMNALAMRDALERARMRACVMSAIPMSGIVEHYDRRRALRYLEAGDVVLFAAGTGNPFFTTDSAACLRGIEIEADLVLKATKVDGVFTADPVNRADAVLLDRLSYAQVLEQDLGVMDQTAICLCRDHGMPVRVFNMSEPGMLRRLMLGEEHGTLIHEG